VVAEFTLVDRKRAAVPLGASSHQTVWTQQSEIESLFASARLDSAINTGEGNDRVALAAAEL